MQISFENIKIKQIFLNISINISILIVTTKILNRYYNL
jgi:hypothetical protein